MRTPAFLICLLAMLGTGNLIAAEADAATDAALKTVEQALQPILEKLEPKPEVTRPDNGPTLVVAYKSQMFKVHSRSMTGEIWPEAEDALGPSFKGFVLRVHVQDAGEVNQADTPQTLRDPYWQTYLDVTPLAGTKKQIYWGLAYGVRTDPELLAQIRRRLSEAKGTPGKPAAEKQP